MPAEKKPWAGTAPAEEIVGTLPTRDDSAVKGLVGAFGADAASSAVATVSLGISGVPGGVISSYFGVDALVDFGVVKSCCTASVFTTELAVNDGTAELALKALTILEAGTCQFEDPFDPSTKSSPLGLPCVRFAPSCSLNPPPPSPNFKPVCKAARELGSVAGVEHLAGGPNEDIDINRDLSGVLRDRPWTCVDDKEGEAEIGRRAS